ncbi:hypothetical protein ACFW81_11445 [Streptomyces angustmyceticus]|uniref:hypothetical protein n=1 Tax=Streptomyces angustmyceticus TaxID=285578 RepID=UPI003686F531
MLTLRATWAVWCNRRVIRETPNSPTARVSAIAKAEEPMMARSRRRHALGPQPHRAAADVWPAPSGSPRSVQPLSSTAVPAAGECEHIVRSPRGDKER